MKNDRVRLGIIGVGNRGMSLLRMLLGMDDVDITALSDVYPDRTEAAAGAIYEARGARPFITADYRELLCREDVDGVIIATSWQTHIKVTIDALRAGKYPACEVGGANSVEECFDLVRVYEETGVPCMFLENCCYGRSELAVLNMVKQGVFGEIVHAQAGYEHDLREEISRGYVNRHYRLDNYLRRNGENYPTHGALPMGKILGINRGNRFVSLVSVASKARGLEDYILRNNPDERLKNTPFAQGDIVNTVLKCAGGETLLLTLDTTLPRPYSRGGRVQGTRGIWMEDNASVYVEGASEPHKWDPQDKWFEKYEHPLWRWFKTLNIKAGHGGMDYLVLRAYVESLKEGAQPPIDVYDFAVYAAITPLSEASVAMGGAPVEFPDFTHGEWTVRPAERKWKYSLSEVCGP